MSVVAGPGAPAASAVARSRLAGPAAVALLTAALLAGAQLLLQLAPRLGTGLMDASSTDWPTLRHDPVLPWITSAVWVSEGIEATVLWVVVLPPALGLLCRRLGVGRGLLVAGGAHVLASVGSEGLLAVRYGLGDVPRGALHLLDVGPSYLAVAAVAALVVAADGRWRLVAAAVLAVLLLAPPIGLLDGLSTLAVSPVGHVLATLLGLAGALLARRRYRRGGLPVSR